MPRKTDGEKIDELGEKFHELNLLVVTLEERVNNLLDEVKDLKRELEEARRRLWLIVPPLLAAFVSAGLTALVTYLFRH
jgi:uncharacterized coiled-coil DUF342 family protein